MSVTKYLLFSIQTLFIHNLESIDYKNHYTLSSIDKASFFNFSFSYEADPEATDDRGYTALRYAMEFCQEESAKILEQFISECPSIDFPKNSY